MALPVVIPNTFANANASIPLSQLDNNFSTVAVAINGMANGAEALANVNITGGSIANASLSNVSISSGNVTINVANVTTLDATNVEVTNIKAKDGTASATIADSTGVMTIGSSVLTTTDINGGTIDGAVIGGSSAAAGSFTTISSTVTAGVASVRSAASAGGDAVELVPQGAGGGAIIQGTNSAGSAFVPLYIKGTTVNIGAGAGGTTVGTFSSTGLAVTGDISSTTEVSAVEFQLTGIGSFSQGSLYLNATHGLIVVGKAGSTNDVYITGSGGAAAITVPTGTANVGIGGNLTVTGATITTGSTTALSLATSGGVGLSVVNQASAVAYLAAYGAVTTTDPVLLGAGETNTGLILSSSGTGSVRVLTGGISNEQVRITHTASANRHITLTGSNGGNPTISTSAGSLAITPNIVCSGAVYTGNNANAGIENVYNGAVAADANIDLPIHVKGGMVVIRDNSSGGTALALVDEATGVTIVSDPSAILATADPGSGGNKFWLQCNSGGQYTRITNRFGVTKAIGFSALSSVMN